MLKGGETYAKQFIQSWSGMNPQMIIQNLMYQNPQVRQIMENINQYGGDPKTAFYRLAQQRGIDPNQIIGMIKQNF